MNNNYNILGLNDRASQAQVKKRYRQLAFKYHPDLHGDKFLQQFKLVKQAYQNILNNVEYVQEYIKRDKSAFPYPESGKNVRVSFNFCDEESFIINYKIKIVCSSCDGKSVISSTDPEICFACKGKGRIKYQQLKSLQCPICSGKCYIFNGKNSCQDCHGLGIKTQERQISIPNRSYRNGQEIIISGYGDQGKFGGDNGDLIIQIIRR